MSNHAQRDAALSARWICHESGGGPGESPGSMDDDAVHVFTDAELRARDERIIRAAFAALSLDLSPDARPDWFTEIIAAAEVDA